MGEHLDPLDVMHALRLPHDHVHRNGEPRFGRRRNGEVVAYVPFNHGQWSMSSEKWVESSTLNTHLSWLLDQIEPLAEQLQALLDRGYEADFFCFSEGRSPDPPSLPRQTRERAEALGIKIDIDHYDSTEYSHPEE